MIRVLLVATLLVGALSLGLSFAHLLEAGPRLGVWSAELWREATVFNGQYYLFGIAGAPLDVGAPLLMGALAWALRGEGAAARLALAGAALFALALAVWLWRVAPANQILATWRPGPLPADADAVRLRWEVGHIAVFALKLPGFAALAAAVSAVPRR
jgi:hypothetical protein